MTYIDYINWEDKRFTRYLKGRDLYHGLHHKVFNINQFDYYTDPENQYIVYNYAEILTNAFNNLIWSEEPVISFQSDANQKFFEDFVGHDGFYLKMRQATETSSYAGDAVLQVMVDEVEPGRFGIVMNQLDNGIWFPIFDKGNPNKQAKGHIKYIEKEVNHSRDKAILLEVHTSGKIEWESYVREGRNEYKPVDPLAHFREEMENVLVENNLSAKDSKYKYQTNCKYPLIFQLSNHKVAGNFFGVSDYTVPVIAKMYNINQNYNQIQYVLKKHAHPKMVVPKDVIKQAIKQVTSSNEKALEFNFESMEHASRLAGQEKNLFETLIAQKLVEKLEFYGSDINTSDPKYLTWDGNLNESREQINMLRQSLFDETQLAKVLIDPDISLGSASGVAILRLAQPSLHKAVMKQAYLRDCMGKMIYTILDLAKNAQVEGSEGLTPEIPTIKFRDGLVNDIKDIIEQQSMLLDSQLTTKIDAIIATQNLTKEQAEAKYNEIMTQNNLFGGDLPRDQNNLTLND